MGESTKQHLKQLLESFDTAMLITRCGDRAHARPMAVAAIEGANTIWFATAMTAPKAEEIRKDSRISATFQGRGRYVALSGCAELVTDREKIHELYKPTWRLWFPQGKDDPALVLIKVSVTDAEYWDNTGARGLRYAFEAAKALVTKHQVTAGAGQHGRIKAANGGEPISMRYT